MTEETTALTITLPSRESARQQLALVRDFQHTVRELFVRDHDFGVIPGTQKPTLLKPGAEKLAKLLRLADTYDFLEKAEDWDRGFFNYTVRCRLVSLDSGQVIAEGLGNCNSWEAKYRWRWVWPRELSDEEKVGLKTREVRNGGKQYRIENDDIYSQVNTVIKMAKKRALVDAALSAGRLSDVFTQDLDEVVDGEARDLPAEEPPASQAAVAKYRKGLTRAEELRIDVAPFLPPDGVTMVWLTNKSAELKAAIDAAQSEQAADAALDATVAAAKATAKAEGRSVGSALVVPDTSDEARPTQEALDQYVNRLKRAGALGIDLAPFDGDLGRLTAAQLDELRKRLDVLIAENEPAERLI